jgi:hypothetical protein
MSKLAIWAEVEAKPGKEQVVAEFLKSAQALAEKEQGTITWYAVKLGGGFPNPFRSNLRGRTLHRGESSCPARCFAWRTRRCQRRIRWFSCSPPFGEAFQNRGYGNCSC